MEKIVRNWDYWAYLFRVTHRESIPGIDEYDAQLVEFIVAALNLEPGDSLLDLACGSGVHGVRLAQRGIQVTGVDISPSLVAYANELAREQGVEKVGFVVGDMRDVREASCGDVYDAVTILSQSFGFFGPEQDMQVLQAIHNALEGGGRFLLDLDDPAQLEEPRQRWRELDGGFLLSQAQYDPVTCVRTATFRYVDSQGRLNLAEEPERIWVYSLPELSAMIDKVGLQIEAVYGKMALALIPYGPDCRERRLLVGKKA